MAVALEPHPTWRSTLLVDVSYHLHFTRRFFASFYQETSLDSFVFHGQLPVIAQWLPIRNNDSNF